MASKKFDEAIKKFELAQTILPEKTYPQER